MNLPPALKWCVAWVFPLLLSSASSVTASELGPLELFNQRIMPIFQAENPSSCVQCHLASVDLKNYILPSSDATFVSLRDQGLIDLDEPEKSKILELIRMGNQDLDEAAKLIHEETRRQELEAFTAWLRACSQEPRMRQLPAATKLAKPPVADQVIRHARKSRVVDSFVRNVWSQRMRCFPCHTPHEIDPDNPKHAAAIKTRAKFAEQYGPEMLERLAIFKETPEQTLHYLIESSKRTPDDRLPMIDFEDPQQSLLIQKPMSKLPPKKADGTFEAPTYRQPLSHLGGLKLHPHDQSYKSFVAWIQDYARVVDGEYKSIEELPEDNWIPSQFVVRVKGAPESWSVGTPVQLFVHEWHAGQESWSDEPIGFTQGTVNPRHIINGAIFLLGSEDTERTRQWKANPKLPRGRYLVKVYVDLQGKLKDDPARMLSQDDYVGQAEIPKARWRPGFRTAEVISGDDLK